MTHVVSPKNALNRILEVLAVLFALPVWKTKFFRKRLILHRDNLGTVEAWAALKSKCKIVLHLMRLMVAIAAESNLLFTLKHLPGVDNTRADLLSRFQIERFRLLAQNGSLVHDDNPEAKNIFSSVMTRYHL